MNSDSTVFVVDDDEALRNSLKWLFETEGYRVQTFATTDAFLAEYDPRTIGCLVLDIRMPESSGLDLQTQLTQRRINIPVIIITGYGDVPTAVQALRGGAVDYLEKPFDNRILLERIREAIERDRMAHDEEARIAEACERHNRLTKRERQVMELVVTGLANKQIAAHLSLSHKTIEIHRSQVMKKMEASSLPELVRLAAQIGSVAEPDSADDVPPAHDSD